MTITSPPASASGSKAKTKAKANSGPSTRGGKQADGKTSRQRVEDAVADRIIELLDQGQLPPWEKDRRDSANGLPRNAVSMKPHRGVNRWMTLLTHMVMGYQAPRWLTHRQAEALGGHVRRGETSTEIVFWKRVPVRDREDGGWNGPQGDGQPEGNPMGEDGKLRTHPMLRSHRVFSVGWTGDCRIQPLPYPAHQRHSPALYPGQFVHVHPQALRNHLDPQLLQQQVEPAPPGAPFSSDSRIVLTSPYIWAKWAF